MVKARRWECECSVPSPQGTLGGAYSEVGWSTRHNKHAFLMYLSHKWLEQLFLMTKWTNIEQTCKQRHSHINRNEYDFYNLLKANEMRLWDTVEKLGFNQHLDCKEMDFRPVLHDLPVKTMKPKQYIASRQPEIRDILWNVTMFTECFHYAMYVKNETYHHATELVVPGLADEA